MPVFSAENGFADANGYDEKALNRQNARYKVFIEPIAGRFAGKRVLDLGSHDGRWAFASLANGAAHITGIEYRHEHIDRAAHFFTPKMQKQVSFIQGDFFKILPRLAVEGQKFDIILCLGVISHTANHDLLLRLMAGFEPEMMIIDGLMIDSDEKFVQIKTEPTNGLVCAPPAFPGQRMTPVGLISRAGLRQLAKCNGYSVANFPWAKKQFENKAGLTDYLWLNKFHAKGYSMLLEPQLEGVPED